MPGRYRLNVGFPGAGVPWLPESISAGSTDALDFPLEVKPGQNVGGVVVTLTDQQTELTGTIVDAKGRPALDHTILLYPADSKYWLPQSRRIRTTRASSDGTYSMRAVPPGDYRLTTLVDPEPGAWFDAGVLEQLDSASVRISLAPGEKKVEHLRVRTDG